MSAILHPRHGIAAPDLTATQFAEIARERLSYREGEHDGDYRLNPDFEEFIVSKATRPAAVLIGVVERAAGLHVLLTKRPDHLRSHSGQVAFPGGKIDETDESAEAAALREAREEVALERSMAEIVGRLPDYFTGSGYRIAPVLALIDPTARLKPNPDEVEYVFETPLSFLMDTANHRLGSRVFQGKTRHFLEMPWQGHYIWGVTAGILRVMHDRLSA
jgi:8-oxo-dGTP pyrophosphatase MutT (NUDIX family)